MENKDITESGSRVPKIVTSQYKPNKRKRPLGTATGITQNILWVKKSATYLNIAKIENDLGMPDGTLKKFVDGIAELSEQWHKPVRHWVCKFRQ